MIKSWKLFVGFGCILVALAGVLQYTYMNISRMKKELKNRKTYDREISLINKLLLKTEDYYSNSNKLIFDDNPEITSLLNSQGDSITVAIGELEAVTLEKPYAPLVDSVSQLYLDLRENMSTLIRFKESNDFSFDAPLLKFISQVSDSLRNDDKSMQLTTIQSTTIVVEKPVIVEVGNQRKNKKSKKNTLTVRPDSLLPSVKNYQQTDTLLKDSTFLSKVDSTFQKMRSEIGRIKTRANRKQEGLALKYAELEASKNGLFAQINSLLQKIRQAEETQINLKIQEASANADHTFSSLVFLFIAAGVLALIFFTLIFYDISRSNYYRSKLETAKARAEKLAKDKENFLATMSHELRTPLNAITGFAHLLKDQPLPEETQQHVKQINRSAAHLLSLVNKTLDYTKLENGTAEPHLVNFDLEECLMEVLGPAEVLAKTKKLRLQHQLQRIPFQLHGDPTWLKQILYNLLGNAIKYTATGTVTVKSEWKEEGGKIMLELTVADTGPGIPKDLQATLFLAYKQLPASSSEGTGLGLAITQKMTEGLGGQIRLESEVGKGSAFIVRIPYTKGPELATIPEKKKSPAANLFGKEVLLVDDDEPSLLLMRLLLERWNAKVTLAKSIREASEKLHEKLFSSVIMDWNLGDGTAEILLDSISPGEKFPPVIISSGNDSLRAIAVKYPHLDLSFVPKPIDPAVLAACLEEKITT